MTDILQLPGWTVSSTTDDGKRLVIAAQYAKQPDSCPLCGLVGALYRHGPRSLTILDSPVRGRPSCIEAKVQRYKCRDCSGTFLQPLEGIDAERRMTERCLAYIEQQCLRDTFQRVSEHLGCDEKTVRNVAGDLIEAMSVEYKPYLPEWIGLDETHLNKIFRGIITDIGNGRPIDLLPGRDKPQLIRWFSQFPDRSHVKGLAIDMWAPYRDVAGLMFKDLPVVIDRFHVVKKANESIERTRIRLGKDQKAAVRKGWMRSKALLRLRNKDLSVKQRFNLDMWLANEPEVAEAYKLKERLFDIYTLPKDAAIRDFDSFAGDVPDSLKADFKDLLSAMKNWRKEILNYFDFPITNAYTEGVNGVAKVMNRMGRGYSFEVIRARLLFNNREPSKRQLRAKRAAQAQMPIADEPMHRCACCGGLFLEDELAGHHIDHVRPRGATAPEIVESLLMVCADCNWRFHPDEFIHDSPLSTE
jgi:transposase